MISRSLLTLSRSFTPLLRRIVAPCVCSQLSCNSASMQRSRASVRFFAKGMDRGGRDGKQKRTKASAQKEKKHKEVDNLYVDLSSVKSKTSQIISTFQNDLNQIKVGQVNPAMLDTIRITAYGVLSPLRNHASIFARSQQTLIISLHDEALLKETEKAIRNANLKVQPIIEGKNILLSFPKTTREERQQLVQEAKRRAEEMKNRIRRVRQEELSEVKRLGLPRDEQFRAEKDVQSLIDDATDEVKNMFDKKEKDLLTA
eukprot:TRINITY_DN1547_c1_g1_i1.p1 TRINITY_DN1547_c1_g1~~TRINITY_DN1547_c1_g1_i1.p1  ORF type:complete len:258 (+),score=40.00 TRINITY_DN1547_c1_g1_i1:49-822(+)